MAEVRHRALLERDSDGGVWLGSLVEVPECHTYGRSIAQTRRRLREAAELWVDHPGKAGIDAHVKLPPSARQAVDQALAARKASAEAATLAGAATKSAVTILTREYRLSRRDVATLLGISHQRVAQLLAD